MFRSASGTYQKRPDKQICFIRLKCYETMNKKLGAFIALFTCLGAPCLHAETILSQCRGFSRGRYGLGDTATNGHDLIQTPNLDKLASQGVKSTQCYAACGACSPSRSAMSGKPARINDLVGRPLQTKEHSVFICKAAGLELYLGK